MGWSPDAVPAWERLTLPVGPGHDVITVVRAAPGRTDTPDTGGTADARPAVLLVHGYNDYVFQAHVADALQARGYACYGLDLRRCGRSARPGQVPHFTTDLAEYRADLDAALEVIRAAGHPWVAVAGHSTGGLISVLWAAARRDGGGPDGLVLNSPWLCLNGGRVRRTWQAAAVGLVGRRAPLRVVERGGGSAYQRQLHVTNGGRWQYDLRLKPPGGFPVRAGWFRAVVAGQRTVARGLGLAVPVLVCTSASGGPNRDDNPDLGRQDTVLDPAHTWRLAPRLGSDVTLVRVADGVHDLSLSTDGPRGRYLDAVLDWLDARTAGDQRSPNGPSAQSG